MIRGHITNKPAIMKAIEFGFDIIDHCDDMDDEVIQALVETNICVTPSLQFPKTLYDAGAAEMVGFSSEEMRADLQRVYDILPVAEEAGVRFLLGDDYGAPGLDHGRYGEEFSTYMQGCGLPFHVILKWATANATALLKTSDSLGTLEAGKIADIVVVQGNPADDPSVMSKSLPVAVMKDGRTVAGFLPTREAVPA
jgi:imidazolonepropionase-like amidohydrolase